MFLVHDKNDVLLKPVELVVDDEQPYTDIMQSLSRRKTFDLP